MLTPISSIIYVPPKYRVESQIEVGKKNENNSAKTCNDCQVGFVNGEEMRDHYKSQGHIENIINKLNAVDIEEEHKGIEETITIVNKSDMLVCSAENNTIAIFPQLFDKSLFANLSVETLNSQLKRFSNQKWGFLLLSGGDFAGAIFDLNSGKVLCHKSIHRYTTRRKQGGGQSSHDQSKGKASSAGSSIRRHNEVALVSDIVAFVSGEALFQEVDVIWLYGAKKNELILKNCLYQCGNFKETKKVPLSLGKPTFKVARDCFESLYNFQSAEFDVIKVSLLPSDNDLSKESENDSLESFGDKSMMKDEEQQSESTSKKKRRKKKKKKTTYEISDDVLDLRDPAASEKPSARDNLTIQKAKPIDRVPDRSKILEATLNRLNSIKCVCGNTIHLPYTFKKEGIKYCSLECMKK
eukprot:NODE_96_length_20709_cov_1.429161.p3 type:complete len:411 gc:universal NODE_96_length_20709_cov_1.429161:17702-16470(-)